jgi:cytochrome c553
MTPTRLTIALAAWTALALAAGCANPERSRDLSNPAVSGQVLAQQVCSMCHGLNGTAVSPNFPNLAGQSDTYLAGQLKNFRGQHRRDPAGFEYMWGLSRSLTDAQIDGLADYFAHAAPQRQPVEGEPARIAAGQQIFEQGLPAKSIPACAGCHGDKGQGNGMFPRLAGQHRDYLVKQLTVFQRTDERSDAQTMPTGAVMKTVAHELGSEDIANVAAYAQALPNR